MKITLEISEEYLALIDEIAEPVFRRPSLALPVHVKIDAQYLERERTANYRSEYFRGEMFAMADRYFVQTSNTSNTSSNSSLGAVSINLAFLALKSTDLIWSTMT